MILTMMMMIQKIYMSQMCDTCSFHVLNLMVVIMAMVMVVVIMMMMEDADNDADEDDDGR